MGNNKEMDKMESRVFKIGEVEKMEVKSMKKKKRRREVKKAWEEIDNKEEKVEDKSIEKKNMKKEVK
ncbi:hypothetical protein GDO81_027990 [Engystomops pustulosus]|uniref:Uncharacterized protein n=1 Tax=Engystomops pustulosus TaxID=76066 RepID=A0AAV6YYF6_ENGPU|nr:hypothetical protein GDO81_027990 [Engystomops pustulosus]